MKYIPITFLTVLCSTLCTGAEVSAELAAAKARYDAASAAALKPLRERYIQELNQIKGRALTSRNLELAVAADAEIKALSPQPQKIETTASSAGTPTSSQTPSQIPPEAIRGKKSHYLWVETGSNVSWDRAQAAAKAAGGNLVSINDRKEWDEVSEYAVNMRPKSVGGSGRYWLGSYRGPDGKPMWVDGTKFSQIMPSKERIPEKDDFHIQVNKSNEWGIKLGDDVAGTTAYIIEWPHKK